jgi:TRAP-type C4-dicarboxylate transport system substrate-binding protein
MSPEVLIMSLRAWQSLSDADKAVFREAARESNRFMREQWAALETQSARVARQAGVTIVSDFDRKPFETSMAKIYAQSATDPVIGPMIDRIRQVK